MSALRLCASRLLSSRPSAFISPSRAYSSFITASTRRSAPRSSIFLSTQRWASTETQEGASTSEIAEQSVTTEDNAPPAVAESANLTEATEESLPAAETNENILPESSQAVQETSETTFKTQDGESPKPTVYIGNLFFDITESELVKEFTQFGTIARCKIIRDTRGLSKGFAYLEFATTEAAEIAIKSMNMQLFEGRRMTVQFAARDISTGPSETRRNKPINPPSSTLFVGNMSFEMTDRDLGNLFRGIRNVLDVRVAIDRRTGQPRGFAHADFVDVKSAMEAMKILQEKETYGRRLRVDYSYSSSQSPRNRADSPRSHPTETRANGQGEDHQS